MEAGQASTADQGENASLRGALGSLPGTDQSVQTNTLAFHQTGSCLGARPGSGLWRAPVPCQGWCREGAQEGSEGTARAELHSGHSPAPQDPSLQAE